MAAKSKNLEKNQPPPKTTENAQRGEGENVC